MSGPIEKPRPIRLGYDLEGNPVVARPEPEESLVDFLERAGRMGDQLEEMNSASRVTMARLLEAFAALSGALAKVAGTPPDEIEEHRQDSKDLKEIAQALRDADLRAARAIVDRMDRPELVVPIAILQALRD